MGNPLKSDNKSLDNSKFEQFRVELLKSEFGSDLKKPVSEDFGLDSEQLIAAQAAYDHNQKVIIHNRKTLKKRDIYSVLLPIIGELTEHLVFPFKEEILIGKKYEEYIKKLKDYNDCEQIISEIKDKERFLEVRKKEAEYWFALGGFEFEEEVSKLFQRSGHFINVLKTKGTGDGGIDLILTPQDGTKILVQCKAHKVAIGPHVARDLYGAMQSAGINKGIIISLGGVTQGVRDFIEGKDISIIDVAGILKLQKIILNE